MEPAILNARSLGIDVAGNAKYFLAILDKAGYLPFVSFQPFKWTDFEWILIHVSSHL